MPGTYSMMKYGELRYGARLFEEALVRLGARDVVGMDELDRDVSLEAHVSSEQDDAHRALTEVAENPVGACEDLPDRRHPPEPRDVDLRLARRRWRTTWHRRSVLGPRARARDACTRAATGRSLGGGCVVVVGSHACPSARRNDARVLQDMQQ
jgi:hypothetical protein